jgi:ParB family chromosome partitioning protein
MGRYDHIKMGIEAVKPTGQPRPNANQSPVVQHAGLADKLTKAESKIADLEMQLEAAKAAGGALEIPLDRLTEVPGRRRKLTSEEFSELKENLDRHELITPITVLPRADGFYEIVSGHNRVAAYRELGKSTIKAWPANAEAHKADELAFYANLLHPDLTDFEKYLGFKLISERAGIQTAEELAERTGLSARQIRRLMAFGSLPEGAIALLDAWPGAIGANTAEALAKLAVEGKGAQVIEAIKTLTNGEATEQQAVRLAAAEPKPEKKRAAPTTIKAGKAIYCRMHAADKVLRLEFASPEQREAAQKAVAEVLERLKKDFG